MMETIRIRRAGYPIRHLFYDFVERYRILVRGVRPPHLEDCRLAARKICLAVLGQLDYQLGNTKVFLKVVCSSFWNKLFLSIVAAAEVEIILDFLFYNLLFVVFVTWIIVQHNRGVWYLCQADLIPSLA